MGYEISEKDRGILWELAKKQLFYANQECNLEITQRDVYTINRDIPKAKRYVDIIKEEIVNCW